VERIWLSGQLVRVVLCERCGALVVDADLHERFHAQTLPIPDAELDDPPAP
jgi:hypothetical protein